MMAKFSVADITSRKFNVFYESVVFVAILCIFMRFSKRFRFTLVGAVKREVFVYMFVVCMYRARILTACYYLKHTQIVWRAYQQRNGHNLEEVGKEISQITVATIEAFRNI